VREISGSGKKPILRNLSDLPVKTMPVLFGYLVALMLLLGGGYAGLQWLGSPDAISTHQRMGEKPIARNLPKKTELKSESSAGDATAVPGEADGGSRNETTVGAATAMEAPHQPDHQGNETAANAKPADPAPAGNDSANAGRKDDVATTSGTSNQNAVPEPRPAKSAAASAEVGQDAEHKDVAEHKDAAKHKDVAKHQDAAEHKHDAQHKDAAEPRDIASTQKQSEPRPEPGVEPRKQDRRYARSSRPRQLVMMYLRTIEFPDGHREQQLLPIRRSRVMPIEAEDQW
jgi:hypothetical protein